MGVGATRKLISTRVGEGGLKAGSDVLNVQQLLWAAGATDPNIAGSWGPACNKALNAAQERHGYPRLNYVNPDDDILLDLCQDAQIVIPLYGLSDITGVGVLYLWASESGVKYDPGAEHGQGACAFYGLDFQGKTDYIVMKQSLKFLRGPVRLDCTTYANINLSVYRQGHVHATPYDADCSQFGGTSSVHMSRDRYGYKLVRRGEGATAPNFFHLDADEIAAATKTGRMYHMELAVPGTGSVKHMAVMHNGWVFECTTGQSGSACLCRTLPEFIKSKSGRIIYLFEQP